MVDAELKEGNAGLEEEEARNRPEEARELGIARAVIARETRPKPVEQWLERDRRKDLQAGKIPGG